MKKNTILSTIFILTVTMLSCKKETFEQPRNLLPGQSTSLLGTKTIISDWFDMSFTLISDRGEFYLKGSHSFNTSLVYDKSLHVELAYVMMPGLQRVPEIKRLPMKLPVETPAGDKLMYAFHFSIDSRAFELVIKNVDPLSANPDAVYCRDFNYRYIIIPKELFDSFNIDWDNYPEVANALNL